ncbi:hypothetical protein N9B73_00650 [Verrucomicrobiales bacterium]|jgi:hypothetical protein|nr:hypothetical protein [Verrucomicrobiales bacterium]|tara:strand:+ start:241 stop:492 length:252 start_codon:yes stop_codon:yes gene_type:complete
MSSGKQDWQWNEDRWGYDGVHLYTAELLWYTHKHNPHGGGGAASQSLSSFLENGPRCSTPPEVPAELKEAVKHLINEANKSDS